MTTDKQFWFCKYIASSDIYKEGQYEGCALSLRLMALFLATDLIRLMAATCRTALLMEIN